MTRPTAIQLALARSTLPPRRTASTPSRPINNPFAALLRNSTLRRGSASRTPNVSPATYKSPLLAAKPSSGAPAGDSTPISRSNILSNAQQLLDVPYAWGGNDAKGLDCSSYLSKAWGISRHTTDNLSDVTTPISKDELRAGDALNLTTGRDPEGNGHVRIFDRWENAEHTRMSVYEETPPKSTHRTISWDPKYQPLRRTNVTDA